MKRTKLAAAAAAAALAASLSLAGASPANEPVDALVFDAMSAPSTISYTGTVEVVRIGSRGSEASVYSVEHRAPDLTRRVYTSPPNLSGDEVISKGDSSYSIDVKRRRVVEMRNDAVGDQIALDDNYVLLRSNYRAIARGAESLDGRPVFDIALVNKYTHRATMLVRLDEQTKIVLDKQQFSADGSMVSETRFEQVRYTHAIPASDFTVPPQYAWVRGPQFGLPSDNVDRVVRNAGFAARWPRFLPEGFSPVEGRMTAIKGVRTLHLLYSDGIRTVSLFENTSSSALDMTQLRPQATTIAGHDAQYAEQGPIELLAWSNGALHCALVGELRLDELQRIAASIAP